MKDKPVPSHLKKKRKRKVVWKLNKKTWLNAALLS